MYTKIWQNFLLNKSHFVKQHDMCFDCLKIHRVSWCVSYVAIHVIVKGFPESSETRP